MSHLVFDTNPSKGLSVDYNKPLFVPAGGDSLAEIGAPPLADQALGSIHVSKPIELWKTAFSSYFPQKVALEYITKVSFKQLKFSLRTCSRTYNEAL